MKMRAGFLVTCAASALVIGMGFASPALAADKMVTKAPAAEPIQWWYEGFVEVGGRFNLNSPDKTKLGKFYEYRDLRPGVFGNFYIAAHRNNPIDIALWGKNVGWDDQAFGFEYAKPGQYYVTLGWDQTPHVFARNAKTTYSGGNVLSTPTLTFGTFPVTLASVNANLRSVDLQIRRDTASAAVRWTPTDNWDVNADYSHMHRHGTQALSAITYYAPVANGTRTSVELPKPVDDTTQNGNLKAEYAGSTPWGKPFNLALGGGFSVYNNNVGCGSVGGGFREPGSSDANCVSFQNPWVAPAGNLANTPAWNRISLAPDNQAQTFSLSGGVGLPFNSRYMGTFQYSRMTQDETFMASTINPAVALATLSANSLNGDVRTTLINNVLNTRITKDLRSTLRYRYFDYHSNQQPITILTNLFANPDSNVTNDAPLTTTPLNFNKQNASGELAWHALKWLNTGAAYEWERKQRNTAGVNTVTLATGVFDIVTQENAVKAFADAKWSWSTLRTSLRYSERRFDGDYIRIANNNNAFRTVDAQDRNSTQGQVSWAIEAMPTVTITPVAGFRVDDYKTNGITDIGINTYETWNAGGDIAWTINPRASFYVSYMHDNSHRNVYQRTVPSDVVLDTTDFIDTIIVGGKFTAIPDKLFLNANYTFTRSTSKWSSNCGPTGACNAILATTIFPDTHNTNHRVDASAKYVFDRGTVKAAGFSGETFMKARVVWEHNSNDSWQSIDQQLAWAVIPTSTNTTLQHSLFLGTGSPNYDVVVGQLSFGVKW